MLIFVKGKLLCLAHAAMLMALLLAVATFGQAIYTIFIEVRCIRFLILFSLFFLANTDGSAMGLQRLPLDYLYKSSRQVVLAEVSSVRKYGEEYSIAELKIFKNYKNSASAHTVFVLSYPDFHNDLSDAQYKLGDTVISFLRFDTARQIYQTLNSNNGVKFIRGQEELKSWDKAMNDLVFFLKEERENPCYKLKYEWLAYCYGNSDLKYEAYRFMEKFDYDFPRNENGVRHFKYYSKRYKVAQSLSKSFLEKEVLEYDDIKYAPLVSAYDKIAVVKKLNEEIVNSKDELGVVNLMGAIVAILPKCKLRRIYGDYDDYNYLRYSDKIEGKSSSLKKEFIEVCRRYY